MELRKDSVKDWLCGGGNISLKGGGGNHLDMKRLVHSTYLFHVYSPIAKGG